MKSFEPVYREIEKLFIKKLPDYIDKINKEHNDGILLMPFENKSLEENCIKTPSFKFGIEEAEYTEKDRAIENTIYTVSFEINLNNNTKTTVIILWRYVEAVNRMLEELEENNLWQQIKITDFVKNKIKIQITV